MLLQMSPSLEVSKDQRLFKVIEILHFWAPLKRALSFGVSPTSMILAPASSCMMRPEVTMGDIPSSIRVPGQQVRLKKACELQIKNNTIVTTDRKAPLLEANITLIQ